MPPHRMWKATLGSVAAATILGIVSPAAPAVTAAAQTAPAQTAPAPATVAAAQRDVVERIGLEATAGFDGRFVAGSWVPVTITLAPDRLVAGVFDVDVRLDNGGRITETRPFEVAGGSQKRFRVVVPPVANLAVTVRADGEEPVQVRPSTHQHIASGAFLVGVLGEVPAEPPAVESVATRRRAVYVAVDPEWLALSAHALDSVGTLVAHTHDLERLPDAARRTLGAAVARGVDLTVVADRPGPVDLTALGLPTPATARGEDAELTPDAGAWSVTGDDGRVIAAAAPLGRGRVAVVAAALGAPGLGRDAELWSHLLQPAADRTGATQPTTTTQMLNTSQAVLSGSDLGLPALPWLTAFLVLYVAVVGPGNGLVLSRLGRRELAWVTVPAITVAFGAGAFAASAVASPPAGVATSALVWVDGHASELTLAAVRAPRPGRHTLTLPGQGWDVVAGSFRLPAVLTRGGDAEIGFDLEALEAGTVLAWRTSTADPPLQLIASAGAGGVAATVRNVSDRRIDDVRVLSADQERRVGALEPGQERDVEVHSRTELHFSDPWRNEDDFFIDHGRRAHPQLPMSLATVLRWDVLDRSPGLVWALGSLGAQGGAHAGGQPGEPVRADGRPAGDEGMVVAVGVRPTLAGDGFLSPYAVPRAVVATVGMGGDAHRPSPMALESVESVVLRYRLPAAGDVQALVATLDSGWREPGRPGRFEAPPIAPPPVAVPEVVCDDRGVCTDVEPAPRPLPGPAAPPDTELQVWDVRAGAWVPFTDVFADGEADPARLVSPLGEVHVRAVPHGIFEFAGRGIGARLGGQP